MDISKIDKNFATGTFQDEGTTRFYNIPCEPFDLYGVFYEKETERFVRMPSEIAENVSEGVSYLNTNTAGGRIRFSTDSEIISLSVTYDHLCEMSHMPVSGSSGFTLLRETDSGFVHVTTFMPQHNGNDKNGYGRSVFIWGEKTCVIYDEKHDKPMQNYILFFPLYNDVKSLKIGLNKTAHVSHGKKYKDVKPILYYGSSITQGGCASRPDNSYQAIISKRNNIDFINLGFSGNGKAEPDICEYLANIKCSAFVCDYDHNAPNAEYLEKTHYSLYKAFREKQPETPIIFVSRPDFEHDFSVPKRYKIIKATYRKAKTDGDKNVYLIDGRTFFAGFWRDACTVDGCHPNDLGFSKMAAKIGKLLDKIVNE